MTSPRPPTPRVRVAHFGSPGAFSHMAAERGFGVDAAYLGQPTIPLVFECVRSGGADVGVVPVENSTEGGVTATLDCLLETELTIQREIMLDVVQCLLGLEPNLGKIERVYSHPQALAQCRTWLSTQLAKAALVPCDSTTDAAARAAADPQSAAIASRLAARFFGLQVIHESIQDQAENVTRFFVIGRGAAAPTASDKTSIVFATTHTRGALCQVLNVLANQNLNLTRIESRPARNRPWEYVFFVDLEGHETEPALELALDEARAHSVMLKILGSYPRAA